MQADLYIVDDLKSINDFVKSFSCHIKYLVNAARYFKPTPLFDDTEFDYDT
jgi:hypothetical protein